MHKKHLTSANARYILQEKMHMHQKGERMKISKQKINTILARQNLTQTELARVMNMSRSNLSAVINGKSVRPKSVSKLATALGVDVLDIIETENE